MERLKIKMNETPFAKGVSYQNRLLISFNPRFAKEATGVQHPIYRNSFLHFDTKNNISVRKASYRLH